MKIKVLDDNLQPFDNHNDKTDLTADSFLIIPIIKNIPQKLITLSGKEISRNQQVEILGTIMGRIIEQNMELFFHTNTNFDD